jgi:hypothetical protein
MTTRKLKPNPTVDPNEKPPAVNKPGNPTSVDPNKPITHVTTPEGAIQVARAEGEFGDKVALAGFSVSNFGVFASSEQGVGLVARGGELAAQFEGGIEVGGNLVCSRDSHTAGFRPPA